MQKKHHKLLVCEDLKQKLAYVPTDGFFHAIDSHPNLSHTAIWSSTLHIIFSLINFRCVLKFWKRPAVWFGLGTKTMWLGNDWFCWVSNGIQTPVFCVKVVCDHPHKSQPPALSPLSHFGSVLHYSTCCFHVQLSLMPKTCATIRIWFQGPWPNLDFWPVGNRLADELAVLKGRIFQVQQLLNLLVNWKHQSILTLKLMQSVIYFIDGYKLFTLCINLNDCH